MRYMESWLLPDVGLRVSQWYWHQGIHYEDLDRYVDIVDIDTAYGTRIPDTDGPLWRVVDHYLDLTVRNGRGLTVLDTDELLAALSHGLIEYDTAQAALACAFRAVEGIASHGYEIEPWLAQHGIQLTWHGVE
jgi:predicted RNA-binding protein associated with RNAse of E/G family